MFKLTISKDGSANKEYTDLCQAPQHNATIAFNNDPGWFELDDEGNLVEILMPELVGEEVEKFIESLYDAERFVFGKTNNNKVFLLEEDEETNNVPNPTIKEPKDLSQESATTG